MQTAMPKVIIDATHVKTVVFQLIHIKMSPVRNPTWFIQRDIATPRQIQLFCKWDHACALAQLSSQHLQLHGLAQRLEAGKSAHLALPKGDLQHTVSCCVNALCTVLLTENKTLLLNKEVVVSYLGLWTAASWKFHHELAHFAHIIRGCC